MIFVRERRVEKYFLNFEAKCLVVSEIICNFASNLRY